jgi:hypothetical protein
MQGSVISRIRAMRILKLITVLIFITAKMIRIVQKEVRAREIHCTFLNASPIPTPLAVLA